MSFKQTFRSSKDRNGNSSSVSFRSKPFGKGYTKTVHKAKLLAPDILYSDSSIVKCFIDKIDTETMCDLEIQKNNLTKDICDAFNECFRYKGISKMKVTAISKCLLDEHPSLLCLPFISQAKQQEEWVLLEDPIGKKFVYFTDQYCKNIKGSGKINFVQSLIHHSYHWSKGKMILADLRGTKTSNSFQFTTPTIHSTNRSFGSKDEGLKGIEKCFEKHVCNELCAGMLKPTSETRTSSIPSAPYEPDEMEIADKGQKLYPVLDYSQQQYNPLYPNQLVCNNQNLPFWTSHGPSVTMPSWEFKNLQNNCPNCQYSMLNSCDYANEVFR